MQITITHTPDEGTTATGDTRPFAGTFKGEGWRWGRSIGAWFLPQSRDRIPKAGRIERMRDVLLRAGATVVLDIDHAVTDAAEREANRAERVVDRREALTAKADRKMGEYESARAGVDKIAGMIPFGQPILVGHHSEGRHRRDMDRIDRGMRKSVEAYRASEDASGKVERSEEHNAHRLSGPVTIRRIERLEVEDRDIARKLVGAEAGEWRDRLTLRARELADEIAYWRAHLDALRADGFHQWGPEDFRKGDVALTRFGPKRVLRVNKKTLTLQALYFAGDATLTYDEVTGKVEHEAG